MKAITSRKKEKGSGERETERELLINRNTVLCAIILATVLLVITIFMHRVVLEIREVKIAKFLILPLLNLKFF